MKVSRDRTMSENGIFVCHVGLLIKKRNITKIRTLIIDIRLHEVVTNC